MPHQRLLPEEVDVLLFVPIQRETLALTDELQVWCDVRYQATEVFCHPHAAHANHEILSAFSRREDLRPLPYTMCQMAVSTQPLTNKWTIEGDCVIGLYRRVTFFYLTRCLVYLFLRIVIHPRVFGRFIATALENEKGLTLGVELLFTSNWDIGSEGIVTLVDPVAVFVGLEDGGAIEPGGGEEGLLGDKVGEFCFTVLVVTDVAVADGGVAGVLTGGKADQ